MAIIESTWDMKYIKTLPTRTEIATKNIGEGLH